MKSGHLCIIVASLFLILLAVGPIQHHGRVQAQDAVTARSADAFVDSLCVATHWRYLDTPYGFDYERVLAALVELGIRNTRDSLYSTRPQELGALGIRSTLLVDVPNNTDGDESDIQRQLDAIRLANSQGALIDAVEAPNEPDFFWSRFNKTYKGEGFPEGSLAFQRDMWRLLDADPALSSVSMFGTALGRTYWGSANPFPAGSLTDYVDYGNFHPYPGGNAFNNPFAYAGIRKYYWDSNFPSIALDEHPINFSTYRPPFGDRPMVATETGYSTYTNGQSESVHGRYIPRLYFEYFRLGIARTCIYELIDEFTDPTSREARFGLLRRDVTPKPAYTAIENIIDLLEDPGPAFTPDSLDLDITVDPPPGYGRTYFVHSSLLQKRDGRFYLAVWHEISLNDTSVQPPRELTHPAMPTTLTFGEPVSSATVYTLDLQGNITSTPADLSGNQIDLAVQDRITIVEITPGTGDVSNLNGRITLQGHGAGDMAVPLSIVLTRDDAALPAISVSSSSDGSFSLPDLAAGSYTVWLKQAQYLAVSRPVTMPSADTIDFGMLLTGDVNDDNAVSLADFSLLSGSFNRSSGDAGYDARADLNGDGAVTIVDFSLLSGNFNQGGVPRP